MRAKIHPKYYEDAVVSCVCGNTFTVGSTSEKIEVEICSNCHPFYTGQMKFTGSAGRVEKFQKLMKAGAKKTISKTEKRKLKKQKQLEKEMAGPTSLHELRRAKGKKVKG